MPVKEYYHRNKCPHSEKELRRRPSHTTKKVFYYYQCLKCLRTAGTVRGADIEGDPKKLPLFIELAEW